MSAGEVLGALHELLEREAAAIEQVDTDALAALGSERAALLADLGPLAPGDLPLARAVEEARARNERAARAHLDHVGRQLTRLAHGRSALRGYSPGGAMDAAARFVDRGA